MNPLIQLKKATLVFLVGLGLACFGPSPLVQAVSPPPDGGYFGANTAEGGAGALFSLTTGSNNTALGSQALFSLTTGMQNTATGAQALKNNRSSQNTADGFQALVSNTIGSANTATGWRALFQNTAGAGNTATGYSALLFNDSGGSGNASSNSAFGSYALLSNTDGFQNSAFGSEALESNTTGNSNTAVGLQALANNTTGFGNSAIGWGALSFNTAGQLNTAVGQNALEGSSGNENTALGEGAGALVTTANNVICIGANAVGENLSNSCYIGNIFGQTCTGGASVFVNGAGKLGTTTSSRRFKDDIKPMDKTSEAILALKPVTFRYKKEIDAAGTSQFGLVAEDVQKVNPDLVVRDKEGKPYSVRYDQVNSMLLNEFLKEYRKVEKLEATIVEQQKQIKTLTAVLEKVSAQLEMSKPSPQMVINNAR
jgi:hypothetical protein